MNNDEIKAYIKRRADDLFRFAFVLTASDSGAAEILREAVSDMTAKNKWDREGYETELFRAIYKRALKYRGEPMSRAAVCEKYGEKSEEFFELLSKPLAERARIHLSLYEDLTDGEAAAITG